MTKKTKEKRLFEEISIAGAVLKNRVVMASLTRGRANNSALAPTHIHRLYYSQRANAGLILTESTWVSENAIGFINLPGIYSAKQVAAWQLVTEAVHSAGGKIFVQLVHSGSVSHPDLLHGRLPLGPSAINPVEKTFTPDGFKETLTPKEHTVETIRETIEEFRTAAANARLAGFDGVELHAQLFTLIPQFISSATNKRTDSYGGTIENRSRLLFEILSALKEGFESPAVGVKFTPAAVNNGLIQPDATTIPTYRYIMNKLNEYDLAYVQIVRPAHSLKGTPLDEIENRYFQFFRELYKGRLIANGGFEVESAVKITEEGTADLVSFGRHFIANPDLVRRFMDGIALATPNPETFYTGGEKGYIDYPFAAD